MKRKSPLIDFGSLKFKLWLYFGLFAVVLMVVLWLLQVFFLSTYYQEAKIRETQKVAASIESQISNEVPQHQIREYISDIYKKNEMWISIRSEKGTAVYIPNVQYDNENLEEITLPDAEDLPDDLKEGEGASAEVKPSAFYPTIYLAEIQNLTQELLNSGQQNISKEVKEPSTDQKTLEYAAFLNATISVAVATEAAEENAESGEKSDEPVEEITEEDRMILFIFSPLYPMATTVQILTDQLIIVTIISLLVSIIMAFYMSRMVTKPLTSITESAEELAEGNLGIAFEGEHYSEVIRLADMLNYTSTELEKARNVQRDVIANVSHDLKTPLTMISSYAEMIADFSGEDPEKRTAHLQVIMSETQRLNTLITELLDISKLQSGEKHINLSEFSLKKLIQSIIASYSAYVEQEGYKLIFISNGPAMLCADETRIQQVLDNLITNALKYGGRNRTVEVKLLDEDSHIRCEVTDHGMGISKKDLKHIWERYYKSSTHYSRPDSTGLGLSIVKEILILHKAKFGVESIIKKGSTFWFEIPKEFPISPEKPAELPGPQEDDSEPGPENTIIE